jgi:hypothetical protein
MVEYKLNAQMVQLHYLAEALKIIAPHDISLWKTRQYVRKVKRELQGNELVIICSLSNYKISTYMVWTKCSCTELTKNLISLIPEWARFHPQYTLP